MMISVPSHEGDCTPTPTPVHRPAARLGAAGRARRRSLEGPSLRAASRALPETRETRMGKLLRHRLVSPEKRTVKRIGALRAELFAAETSADVVLPKIIALLQDDRDLKVALDDAAFLELAGWLVDTTHAKRTAADMIGAFLRDVGAMERPELKAPRVKSALRVLNELLYGDDQRGPIPQGVRELRLEKRDGGLQIVAVMRLGADEPAVLAACADALRAAGYADVDVRPLGR